MYFTVGIKDKSVFNREAKFIDLGEVLKSSVKYLS